MFKNPADFTSVSRNEIRGADVLLLRLIEIAERIIHFPKLSVDIGGGAIFYGPKGVGKTLSAKFVATAVRNHARVVDLRAYPRFRDTDGEEDDLTPSDVRIIYSLAEEYIRRRNAAVVILCDEFDDAMEESVIEELRIQLDGMKERTRGIYLLLTSNNSPEDIDERLFRHGRISDHIRFWFATERGRADILRYHTELYPHAENIDYDSMVSLLSNETTAAALSDMPRRAYILECLRTGARGALITERGLLTECVQEAFGPPAEDPLDQTNRRIVAEHEAGHVVFALLLGFDVLAVSVVPRGDGDTLGETRVADRQREIITLDRIEDTIVYSFGGMLAEKILGNPPRDTFTDDLVRMTTDARRYVERGGGGKEFRKRYGWMMCHLTPEQYSDVLRGVVEKDVARLLKKAEKRALAIIEEHGHVRLEKMLRRVAGGLMENGVLLRNELLEFMNDDSLPE